MISADDIILELCNLRHLSRAALAGQQEDHHPYRYKSSVEYYKWTWAAAVFHKNHPELSETFAYKVLDRMLNGSEEIARNFIDAILDDLHRRKTDVVVA